MPYLITTRRRLAHAAINCVSPWIYCLGTIACKSAPLDRLLGKMASVGIVGYQRFLSPFKGYRCSCAVAGGRSCSAVVLESLSQSTFSAGLSAAIIQFERCRDVGRMTNASLVDQAVTHLPQVMDLTGSMVVQGGCLPCDQPPPQPPIP